MERCRYSAESIVIRLQFASITHWRTLKRVDAMVDYSARDKTVLGESLYNFFCFILVCLTDWLQRKQIHSFIQCTRFCFTTGQIPVNDSTTRYSCSRETSRQPTENNNFHWKILIFTDLKKVRFNYHWPLRLKKKKTKQTQTMARF